MRGRGATPDPRVSVRRGRPDPGPGARRRWAPPACAAVLVRLPPLGSVVTFDRPGLGSSPAVAGPRTPTRIARELHDVLATLEVSGPVVLIGHSMGGVHALRYADLYPENVAAVVLIDTPPPGFEQDRLALLTPQEQEQRRAALAAGRSRAVPAVGAERDGAESEAWEFGRLPPDLPVRVIVADSQNFGELGSLEGHRELWLRRSSQWLDVTENAELVVAAGSGHMVHHDRPTLVVDVVARLLAQLGLNGSPR